jgi:bifunctional N-acetylglucosamine-1-phosphate-uridyltransferase/glucosamine-1-phosphate-acetyltransferase GlmU-like protein
MEKNNLNKNIQLIIPMSGIGKRFIDAGYDVPKYLIEVNGKLIIEHVVNLFPGVEDVTFVCNCLHIGKYNLEKILRDIKPNCKINVVSDYDRKGPVHSISKIFDFINDDKEVIISYCDYGTDWNFDKFLLDTRKRDADGAIACYKGFHPHMLGSDNYAFCKEKDRFLIEIKEKESFTDNKMDEYASNGTYFFKNGKILKKYFKELIDKDINIKGEYYVSMVYNLLVKDKLKVSLFEIVKMLQWGTPYDLEIYKGWLRYFKNIKTPQKKINHPKGTTLILPMAGRGSRFEQEGYGLPKPLIMVDGDIMVVKAVDCLPICDDKVFICQSEHNKEYGVSKLLIKKYKNCQVLSIDGVTEGQACTCEIGVKACKVCLDKPILISACDNGVYYDADKYSKLLEDETIDIIVWSFRNNQTSKVNPNAYAWLDVDENGFIKHVSCKKFIYEDPLKTHAIIGTMFFRKGKYFIDGLHSNYAKDIRTNGEFYVDDVLNQNIKSGLKIKVFEVDNYICWGTPDDYKTYLYWMDHFIDKL